LYRPLVPTALVLLLLFSTSAWPHSGRTNEEGCHTNRNSGTTHCHQPNRKHPKTAPSPSIAPGTLPSRLTEYFRQANEGVGALTCDLRLYRRNVSQKTKRAIKLRDGYRCVLCGSNLTLEVDHRRALMNGGSNQMANLATLCDKCHLHKTRMDNSLRRKRKKLCGR